jgi:hypothetical protein
MKTPAPTLLKWAYCLVLLYAVHRLGLAGSSWVALARGEIGDSLPLIGVLPMLTLAVYRIYLVARVPGTLSSYPATGFAGVLRRLGVFGLYVGATGSIASLAAGPLMRALMTSHTESGAEYFVVGMYLSMLVGVGKFGLLCYELSRLTAFEQDASARNPS